MRLSLLLLSFSPLVLGALRRFTLNINNRVVAPDGFSRNAILPNGTFPGPTFFVNKGDSVDIALVNQLTSPDMRRSTSIHWHGFFQARTSGQDGPAFVNQCPIAPNTTFHYQFSIPGQAGNYWYHSHLSTQYCDGLRGAFVVYDPNDPLKSLYDVDDATTVITLAEWYHVFAPEGQDNFYRTGSVPIPDSGLINGRGRFVGGPLVPYAVINVRRGLRYRFRIFALSCRPFFSFSIDNHNITVIELDGVEHDPVTGQTTDVYAAQRISIVVNANQAVGNYWIRAPPTGGAPAGNPNFDPTLTKAILRYVGAAAVEPTTTNVPGRKIWDADMHPIAQEGPGKLGSGPPDVAYNLVISQPNPPLFDINGISYVSPTLPVLLQILSGAAQPQDFLPSSNILLLPPNSTIDISIPGTGSHPFHLHGHNFDIIKDVNTTNDVPNFVNPARRDVVPIIDKNTTFRFFSDNPGAWFLHCHIDWHLEVGLAVAFAESPAANINGPNAQITPADWLNLCPTYDALAPQLQ
jgi:iron transport multicopper oxidase